jgi:RNA binding exosome subunit
MYLYAKYLISSKNETKREALKVFEKLYEVLEGEEKKYLVYNAVNDVKESLLAKRNEQKSVLGKNKENESLRAEFLALEELILSYEQFINNKAKN